MNPEEITEILNRWAHRTSSIRRVWIFGSRAKGTSSPDSDLDVAVELIYREDEVALATYMFEKGGWLSELQPLFPFPLQLELLDENTEIIRKGLSEGSLLVFERDKSNRD